MDADQIASLIEVAIPLLAGCVLLARPSLFTKKNLTAQENVGIKKRLALAGRLALVAAALMFISKAGDILNKKEVPTETFLAGIVSQTNQKLPKTVDPYTSLERLSASDHTLTYHYLLHDLDTSNLSADSVSASFKAALIAQLQKSPNAKQLGIRKIHMRHSYESSDHSFALTIDIAPEDYQ